MSKTKYKGLAAKSLKMIEVHRKKLRKLVEERYERAHHWSGSKMATLEHAFNLLNKEFEDKFMTAFHLVPPTVSDELDVHRAYLRAKSDEANEFFRDHWKDVYERGIPMGPTNETLLEKARADRLEERLKEIRSYLYRNEDALGSKVVNDIKEIIDRAGKTPQSKKSAKPKKPAKS